jgi:predicted ATPase
MAKQDDVEDILELATEFKYEYVFVFERLPYSDEGVRINNEDDALARHLGEQLEIEYRNLGYEVIRVPVMPVDDRVQFILDRVKVEVASPVSVPLVLQPVAV